MIEPKLEVPTELRDLAEKTIDQAEKAFGMFFDAANKSVASIPSPGTEISKQALSFTEQNMKAAFDHARKLVHATDLQQAMQIQSEFLRSQFTNAGEHMRKIGGGARFDDLLEPFGTGRILCGVASRRVVGCDLVELCPIPGNVAPNFLCAKLAYKILSYRFGEEVRGRKSSTFSSGYPAPASHHR